MGSHPSSVHTNQKADDLQKPLGRQQARHLGNIAKQISFSASSIVHSFLNPFSTRIPYILFPISSGAQHTFWFA